MEKIKIASAICKRTEKFARCLQEIKLALAVFVFIFLMLSISAQAVQDIQITAPQNYVVGQDSRIAFSFVAGDGISILAGKKARVAVFEGTSEIGEFQCPIDGSGDCISTNPRLEFLGIEPLNGYSTIGANLDVSQSTQDITIDVYVSTFAGAAIGGGEAVISAITPLAAPNSRSINPSAPKKGQNFEITAYQPSGSQQIGAHIYSFYNVVWDDTLQDYAKVPIASKQNIRVNANQGGLGSTYQYVCAGECAGAMGADIKAVSGSQESAIWHMQPGILFIEEAPQAPVLISTNPPEKYAELKNTGSTFIEPLGSISMEVGPPQSGVAIDRYSITTTRNNQPLNSMTYEEDAANGNLQINLDCASLGCAKNDFIDIEVSGISGSRTGPALRMGFLAYDNTASTPPQLSQVCQTGIGASINYMGAGLIAMAIIIALVYMGGQSLNNPRLLEWSKSEAVQLLFVPVIFIIIIWLANFACTFQMSELFAWAPSLGNYAGPGTGPAVITGDSTPMVAAQQYLNWALGQTHLTMVMVRRDMGALDMRATHNNYDNQGLGFGMNGYSYSMYSGDYTTSGTLGMLLNLNTGFMLTLLFEYFSLVFFSASNGFFFALIPLGLIMRSVPFLRSFGGGMVALGVGLFIFYPLVLAMSGIMLGPIYHGQDASQVYAGYYGGSAAGSLQSMITMVVKDENSITGASSTSYVDSHPQPKVASGDDPNIKNMANVNFSEFFRLTSQNFVRAVLVPTAALLVTIAFIANLAIVFGGEIDASKLTQLV
ncbi:MAG: hypothetical protein V1822_03700 [Candidatus Micrarchaeota archaeon]